MPLRPRSSTSASGPVRRISSVVVVMPRHLPELNPLTRHQQRRRLAVDVPQLGVGAPDQLPATGRLARIDAAELARKADRSCRHLGPRLRSPRHVEPFVAADEVAETRCETGESDPPRRSAYARRRRRAASARSASRRRRGLPRRRPRRSPRRPGRRSGAVASSTASGASRSLLSCCLARWPGSAGRRA